MSKLCGREIADVEGRFTAEFGDVTFKLLRIVFTDGSWLCCEGEHDLPYVTDSIEPILPSNEVISALYNER